MKEQELFTKYINNPSIENRNEIVEKHLYMVDILIRKYLGKGVEYDDLYQVGALALVNAVERFDPEKGYEFSSFATPTILGEIKKYFRDKEWSIKVPRRLKETAAKVQEIREKLREKGNNNPTLQDIAEASGFSQEQVIEAMESAKSYGTYSLDKTYSEAGEEGESSFLEKYTMFEELGYERIETKEIIEKVIGTFTNQEKYIFKQRFLHNCSQAQIASELGVSQMTVSRAEKNIINKFKEEARR
ncbi:MAG: sigma-70 family RNA polymerase sigma factor [Eubacteriaceae bacterium]|nr:sigma-70 family RNA polymerase sigma factor [Eubacteriaceae bacterium]